MYEVWKPLKHQIQSRDYRLETSQRIKVHIFQRHKGGIIPKSSEDTYDFLVGHKRQYWPLELHKFLRGLRIGETRSCTIGRNLPMTKYVDVTALELIEVKDDISILFLNYKYHFG